MIKQNIRIIQNISSYKYVTYIQKISRFSHFLHIFAQIVDLMYTRSTLQKWKKPVLDQIVKRWAKKGSCPGGEMSLE